MKQFRVELGLKVAQEKRSWPLSIQRVVSFNVKLCQQKLYETMFDRASGTSGLGANFPACRKHHRRRPELHPRKERARVPSSPRENGHAAPGARPGRKGQACQSGWKDPRAPAPCPFHAHSPWRGGGRRGEGCLPGNLGRWAGSTACRELCCTTSSHAALPAPAPPRRFLHGSSKQKLLRDSRGSRHRGSF